MTTKENILLILKTHKYKLSKFGVSNISLFGSYRHNKQSNKN